MNGNSSKNWKLKLCRHVNVYELGDKSLLFRGGYKTAKLAIPNTPIKNEEFIDRLAEGVSLEQLSAEEHTESFANSLVELGLARWVPTDFSRRDEEVEDFLTADHVIFPAELGTGMLKKFGVSICSNSNSVRAEIEAILAEMGVRTRQGHIQLDSDKRLSVSIPQKQWDTELLILDLRVFEPPYLRHLAYDLDRRGVEYIPVLQDTGMIMVGPTVVKQGPCLDCYSTRRRGNMQHPEVLDMLASDSTRLVRTGECVVSPQCRRLIAVAVQSLVMSCVLGLQLDPMSRKRRGFRIIPPTSHMESFVLFKDPMCLSCGARSQSPSRRHFVAREYLNNNGAMSAARSNSESMEEDSNVRM